MKKKPRQPERLAKNNISDLALATINLSWQKNYKKWYKKNLVAIKKLEKAVSRWEDRTGSSS